MNKIIVLIVAISLLLIFSGCMNPAPTSTPAPTATSTETPVQTATPVPATTPAPRITATLTVVKPTINVTSYPASVEGEANFTINWDVSGGTQGTISKTMIIWGFNSGGGNITDYPRTSIVQTGQTSKTFSAEMIAPAGGGPVYFRAHAVVDDTDIYSPEYQITIVPRYTGAGGGY